MTLTGSICGEIARRMNDWRFSPGSYITLPQGLRLQAVESDAVALLHPERPQEREIVGWADWDASTGLRWYLRPDWRSGVRSLVMRLGLENAPSTEIDELPV
jgi:hypothetical protein